MRRRAGKEDSSMSENYTLGVLLPVCRGYYFHGVLRGVHQVTRANGARLVVIQTVPPLLDQDAVPRSRDLVPCAQRSVDGWIVVQGAVTRDDAHLLLHAGRPLVTVGGRYLGLACPDVGTDNAAAAATAVRHLLDHGHRRIAFFGMRGGIDPRQRHAGYLRALHERDLEPDPGLLYLAEAQDDVAWVPPVVHRLLSAGNPCTAVFAETDALALAVLRAAQAAGRRVPGDLAVVGFGDTPPALKSAPPLTTVRQNPDALGEAAASLLLAQLAGKPGDDSTAQLDAPLILRASCGCRPPAVSGRRSGTPRTKRQARVADGRAAHPDALDGACVDACTGRGSTFAGLLMNLDGERLLDLSWFAHVPVRRGCLARWDEPVEGGRARRLTVTGCYDRTGAPPVPQGSSWPAEAFPLDAFLTAPEQDDDGPVLVLPMCAAGNDWGVLALDSSGDGAGSWAVAETLDGLSQLAGHVAAALERHELLHSLEAERQLLQTLLDTVPDHIYFKDRRSRIIRANNAHAAYIGLPGPAAEIGKSDFDFYPLDAAQALYDAEQEMMRTGEPQVGIVEDHAAFAQRPCWIQATKVPIVQHGSVVGLVGISRDVTNLKRAEEVLARQAAAAEELAQLRSSFVATVSHELRSPLTAIVGYAELLEAQWGRLDDAARLKMLRSIVVSANRQKHLVEELLLLSRLDLGAATTASPEPTDLGRVVKRAADEIRTSYKGQAIALEGPAEVLVLADPDRTVQILVNLIDNAAKYSPEGSPVHVTWSRNCTHADVRVRDFGAGVSEQGREQLFTRFGRLPGSRIRAGRVGTGLGLYLARSFARVMQGDVELEATSPDGSTFRLSLPLAAGAASSEEEVRRLRVER